MLKAVRHEVWATDSNVALTLTGTLEGYIRQFSYAGPRFGFMLMIIFGTIGLILVTIGVYSLLSYTTARRTQEIGIRMALGAQGADVLSLVIRMGLRLVAIGVGRISRQPGAGTNSRNATVGSVRLRSMDFDVRPDRAAADRIFRLLVACSARRQS